MGTVSERRSWPMRYWVLLWAGYFLVPVFLGDWIEAQLVGFVRWLVAIGGYGLSNAVSGGSAGVVCLALLEVSRRRMHRAEVEGDPEPLKPPFEYRTGAMASVWLGWTAGVFGWGAGIAVLAAGYPEVFLIGPVVGTAAVLGGHLGLAHARVMDAHRGLPPAPAPRAR